jgi:hypothetical protein
VYHIEIWVGIVVVLQPVVRNQGRVGVTHQLLTYYVRAVINMLMPFILMRLIIGVYIGVVLWVCVLPQAFLFV